MPYYKIYAGLSGGFGGATYRYTDEFEDQHEAELAAYVEASGIYDDHEHQILTQEDAKKEALKDFEDFDPDDEDCLEELEIITQEIIENSRENWITCWAEETEAPQDDDSL